MDYTLRSLRLVLGHAGGLVLASYSSAIARSGRGLVYGGHWGGGRELTAVRARLAGIVLLGGLALIMPASSTRAQDCAPMADSTCHCPPGTEYVIDPKGDREAGYTDQVQSIRIEYCRKRDAKHKWLRHGPCIVRGPNDERYEVGEYVDGQRDGVWLFKSGSQVVERAYDHGRYLRDRLRILSVPESVTVDFCNCRVQGGLTYQALGSSWWRLRGAKGDTCIVALGHETEGAYPPTSIYHVPRSLGRLTLPSATLDWTVLSPYFVGTEGKAGNEWFDARR